MGFRVRISLFVFALLFIAVSALASVDTHYMLHNGAGSKTGVDLANAFGETEFNTSGNWDTDIDDDNKIGPGDTVLFYDNSGNFSGVLTVQQSGQSGYPITLKNGTGETPVVSGGSNNIAINAKSYIVVDGLTLQNQTYEWGAGVRTWGECSHITVQNCTVTGSAWNGIHIEDEGGGGNVIANNIVHNNTNYGIQIMGAAYNDRSGGNYVYGNESYSNSSGFYPEFMDNSYIYENKFYNNDGTGEEYGMGVLGCSGNEFYDNEIYGNHNMGVQFYGGNDGSEWGSCNNNKFYRNLIYNHTEGNGYGFNMTSRSSGRTDADNNELYHNLVWGNKVGLIGDSDESQTGNKVYNNVFYGHSSYGLRDEKANQGWAVKNNIFAENTTYDIYAPSTTSLTTSNNLYYRQAGGDRVYYNGSGYTCAEWQSAEEATAQCGAPQFVEGSPSSWYDFRIQSGSPARNTAASLGSPYNAQLDPNDVTWPPSTLFQETMDIGAFGYDEGTTGVETLQGSIQGTIP